MLQRIGWFIFTLLGGLIVSGGPNVSKRAPDTAEVVVWLLVELLLDYLVLGGEVFQDAPGEPVVEPAGEDVLVTEMLESWRLPVQRLNQLDHVVHPPPHSPPVPTCRLSCVRRYQGYIVAVTYHARLQERVVDDEVSGLVRSAARLQREVNSCYRNKNLKRALLIMLLQS